MKLSTTAILVLAITGASIGVLAPSADAAPQLACSDQLQPTCPGLVCAGTPSAPAPVCVPHPNPTVPVCLGYAACGPVCHDGWAYVGIEYNPLQGQWLCGECEACGNPIW
jgi:hypothetical protein